MSRIDLFKSGRLRAFRPGASRFVLPTALLLATPAAFYAQVTTATLSGTVQDASGSVIPNALVTLKSALNGDTRTSQSDGAGLFAFPSIPSGDYQVTIEAPGFQRYTATGIHLDPADQRALRDIHLAAGGSTENVTVTADTQINLDSGEISSLITSQQIEHLSVEGRDVTELFKTLPGFAINSSGTDNRAYDPSQVSVNGAAGSYAGNGTPLNGVAILTDGADVTDPGNFGAAIQNINYEFVAEVKAQTSSFTADTAHGPIVINAVGKSGGDHFHGSLYTYARTNQLNSNDWISKYTNQPQPPDRQVYPGFTFGGPVIIPGTGFNANKRLTFFVGAEQYAQRNVYAYGGAGSATLTALVPTAGMRNGDFSAGQIQQMLGPGTTPGVDCAPGSYQALCRIPQQGPNGAPLVNGQVTAIDPGGRALLNTLPLPNVASNGTYNYITTNLTDNNLWEAHGRIDDQIGEKNRIFAVYTKEAGKSGVPQNEYYSARSGTTGGTNLPGGGLLSTINSETGSFNLTTVVSPKITNELFGQAAYLLQDFVAKNQASFLSSSVGYPYQGAYANGDPQYPTLEDYSNLPINRTPDTSYGGIYAKKWIRGGGDNVSVLLGAHTLRLGVFTELTNNNEVNAFQNPNGTVASVGFPNNGFTDSMAGVVENTGPASTNPADPSGLASTNSGNAMANFLEGHVATFTQQNINVHPDLYFWNIAGYGQDHWRISPKLTLDLGLRLEHLTPFTDSRGDGVPVWDPTTYGSGTPTANNPLPGFLWHGIDPSVPRSGFTTKAVFIEPRVGLAWDPRGTGLTVVRAGYGIYRAHDSFNAATAGIGSSEGQYSTTVNYALLSTISNLHLPLTAGGSAQNSSPSAFLRGDNQQPQVYTYNFAVDQKVPFNSTIELAYVGNRSDHLLDSGANNGVNVDDKNALPIGALFAGNTPATIGVQNITVGSYSTAQVNAFRPYPYYTHVLAASHRLYSNFNALEAGWSKQQGRFNYSVNYTWSKALGSVGAEGETSTPADPINPRNNYRALGFDRTHIFNANYSYDFGQLVHNRYIGGVVNGWGVSGITQIQSGQNVQDIISPNLGLGGGLILPTQPGQAPGSAPLQVGVSAQSLLGTPDYSLQPVYTCNTTSVKTAPHQTINGNCFALPAAPGINGQYVLPYIHGPAYTESDLTASKTFKIRESQNVQFRIAAFNFLNHANSSFNNADANGPETTLNLSNATASTQENSATLSPSTKNFGFTPLREGRRILELNAKYNF